jgi:DegV family protein with EDD domain
MPKYKLIVDSSCDLPTEFYEKYNIGVTDLVVNFNERQYLDRKEITSSEIIKKYKETGIFPKTSALNIPEIEDMLKREAPEVDHLFYMPISSFISSINNNAHLAVNDLNLQDKVTILDSLSLSSGCALEAIGICEDFTRNLSVEEIIYNHEERTKKISMQFVIQTMEFLHKGGRCSGMTYLLGNKFSIHPIVTLEDGKMNVHSLVRGKDLSKGLSKMFTEFKEQFDKDNIDFSYPILIPHVTGEYGVKKLEDDLKELVGNTILNPVDASGIICCHCGENTVGLCYMLKNAKKD